MREESHLDDMRSAIRGDFKRLAERRGEQELMRLAAPAVDPAPAQEHCDEETAPRSWLARLISL